MEVDRVRAPRWNLVDIEVEWARGGNDEPRDAAFLERLPLGDTEDILIAVAMPAKLKPAVQLAMVMEQGAGPIRIHDKRASSEVTREAIALEAAGRAIEQGKHPLAGRYLLGALSQVKGCELGAKFYPVHREEVTAVTRPGPRTTGDP
jgi:hypothetical protein